MSLACLRNRGPKKKYVAPTLALRVCTYLGMELIVHSSVDETPYGVFFNQLTGAQHQQIVTAVGYRDR